MCIKRKGHFKCGHYDSWTEKCEKIGAKGHKLETKSFWVRRRCTDGCAGAKEGQRRINEFGGEQQASAGGGDGEDYEEALFDEDVPDSHSSSTQSGTSYGSSQSSTRHHHPPYQGSRSRSRNRSNGGQREPSREPPIPTQAMIPPLADPNSRERSRSRVDSKGACADSRYQVPGPGPGPEKTPFYERRHNPNVQTIRREDQPQQNYSNHGEGNFEARYG